MRVSPCSFAQTPTLGENEGKFSQLPLDKLNKLCLEIILHLPLGALYLLPSFSRMSESYVALSKIPTVEQKIYSSFHRVNRYMTTGKNPRMLCLFSWDDEHVLLLLRDTTLVSGDTTWWLLSKISNYYFLYAKQPSDTHAGKINEWRNETQLHSYSLFVSGESEK